MRVVCAGVLLLLSLLSQGQMLRGTIVDKVDRSPLVGALVKLSDGSTAVTDEKGHYQITASKPGRYAVVVNFVAYREYLNAEILLKSNRVIQLDIGLEQLPVSLEEITVYAQQPFQIAGKRMISEDQIYRFASTYYDPARIMTTSPDVIITNDQNNQISVRGLSPNYNVWRLEDVEIINPNHLSNAGTPNDQPSGSGGGVNAISAQILGASSFNFGAMNAGLSNSVGGVFDLKFSNPNDEDLQYAAQASLIGFDFMADGPLSDRSQIMANYRYSFTGLLSQAGVDFGGESIGYQDLSIVSRTTFEKGGNLKFFVVGGNSFNDFEHTGYEEAERQKDLSDINYRGKITVAGLRYDKDAWSFSYALSGTLEDRDEVYYDAFDIPSDYFFTTNKRSIHSALLQRSFQLNNGFVSAQVGWNHYQYSRENETERSASLWKWVNAMGFVGADWQQFIGKKITSELGVKYYQADSESSLDYRAKISYLLGSSSLYVAYGNYSQLINPVNQFFDESGYTSYGETPSLGSFISSQRTLVGFDWQSSIWSGNVEAFHYGFPEVVARGVGTVDASTAGVSANLQRNTGNGWFALIGGTLFNSIYSEEVNNRFNAKYNGVLNTGKEFVLKSQEKRLEISVRQTVQGGNWYNSFRDWRNPTLFDQFRLAGPIDRIQSAPYLRTDLRIQWTKTKPKTTRTFSLDIQNMLNRENESFFYFDAFLNQVEQNTQLGVIPNLTYRIDF
jgi:hypothetical protein